MSVYKKEGVGVGCAPNNFQFWGSIWKKNGELEIAWMRMTITSHSIFVDLVEILERCQESKELSGQEFETFGLGWVPISPGAAVIEGRLGLWRGEKAEKEQNHSDKGLVLSEAEKVTEKSRGWMSLPLEHPVSHSSAFPWPTETLHPRALSYTPRTLAICPFAVTWRLGSPLAVILTFQFSLWKRSQVAREFLIHPGVFCP